MLLAMPGAKPPRDLPLRNQIHEPFKYDVVLLRRNGEYLSLVSTAPGQQIQYNATAFALREVVHPKR